MASFKRFGIVVVQVCVEN